MPQYDRKDKFYQKAKKEGYPARSAYKLIEMDQRFGIFKPGSRIVDLGCAPGGWLKVAEENLVGAAPCGRPGQPHGVAPTNIIGIDLLPLQYTPAPSTIFIQGNFLDPANQQKIIETLNGKADWILSDMSPNISGIKFKDLQASMELCQSALEFAKEILRKGGGLIVKIFPGPEMGSFRKKLREAFERITTVEPEATRKTSTEIYLVCIGFKG
ncbi:MAG: RlmE family RNA methyltransferase [Deltaproteobacteria bacterium]|nr:RlmE family RNA methyltransferase [Deltaproteobacteria bacterium]